MRRPTIRLMWIATAGWLLATIGFLLTGDFLLAVGFVAYTGTGALIASGVAERSSAFGWLTYSLLAVATITVASSAFIS